MKRQNFDLVAFPYILENIDPKPYGVECKTDKEKLQFLFDTFNSEYVFPDNLKRYGNLQNVFCEWLKGLPSVFTIEFENYKIIQLAKKWGLLPENPTRKQEDNLLNNYWSFMANKVFKMFRRYKIS